MNKNPLVTVVTPSLNQGQFIEETIKSVLNQTYKNIEYIVIDGGSTDNTIEILQKYSDRIKYISEKDKGQADAINKGFKMSKGKFVGWINSDDILEKDCIEVVINEFIKDKVVGIVYGNYININEYGQKLNTVKNNSISSNRLLNIDSGLSQPGSFYKLDYIKRVGYLDEDLRYAMDYDLWVKLLKISEIKYVNKVLSYFRLHEQSKTVSETDKFGPEIEKVLKRNGGGLYALPSKYLKENHYEVWFKKIKELIYYIFKDCKGKNIGIYGTGNHTKSMLDTYKVIYGSIDFNVLLFDSDKNKWGKNFLDYEIASPEKINDFNLDRIIISSFSYQEEIYDYLKQIINENIKLIKIYDTHNNCTFFI